MIPETGRRFGPYEILGRLGGGGMGHVFRAWDARLHREVAVKFLHNEYAMPGMRERFLREARAASALNHPNICTVFDIGEQDGDPYLVMELLEGETLKDRIDKRNLPLEEMLCVGKEAAEALGAAHAKGIIHRDVKPANIFLVQKPHAGFQSKVLDFGLAKIEGGVLGARQSRSLDITTVGSTVGTLAYMSPEQARGEVLDSRSDLFSLGVVLYEMATRHIPFPGATSALVFVKLLNHAPEPVRDWNESIPRELEKIILKLMAKERTARFQTAHELYEALCKVGDKPEKGGWLRKAVNAAPNMRPPEAFVKERRSLRRKQPSGSEIVAAREPAPTPRPTQEQAQFLRPIARVPRGDTTPRPPSESPLREPSAAQGATVDAAVMTPAVPAVVSQTVKIPAAVPSPSVPSTSVPSTSVQIEPVLVESGTKDLSSGEFSVPLNPEGSAPRMRFKFDPLWLFGGIVLLVVAIIGAILIFNRGHFSPTMLSETDPIVVTEIENQTGDKSLDGTLSQGLQIALMQSPYLMLRDSGDYRNIRHQIAPDSADGPGEAVARTAAQRLGARAYLYGSIKGSAAPYLLHVSLRDTATNEVMSSIDQQVPSLQQITESIDRVADALRSSIGEGADSIARAHAPLSREATSNVESLHDFSQAEDALSAGQDLDALGLLQQAVALEPRFVIAQLRLAVLYRKQRAELAALAAAKLALAAADNTSERTRTFAQYEYEMNASGDFVRATAIIRKLIAVNPRDSQALDALARALLLQGRMAESLQSAQQAYAIDPMNVDAYTQAATALIGLDRFDASYQLQGQLQKMGLAHAESMLTAAYLEGRQEVTDTAAATFEGRTTGGYRPDWAYGLYLDNTGRLAAGQQLWRKNAQAADEADGLESATPYLLSQGALDRALLGDCDNGLALAREAAQSPQGLTALFNTGMASALCGDSSGARAAVTALQKNYPQSFAVNSFYIADINAGIALAEHDPTTALELLKPARQFDLISLTPFLRGRAHVALRQGQIGIVDYQTVLAHRGVPFIVGSSVFPAAEIGVARAFADTGDLNNSADAYKRFLELWKNADPSQPLLVEARAHTKH